MKHMLIGRGQAGWHSDGLEGKYKCSSSGGLLENYLAEAEDGTPIYDASEAEIGAFCELTIAGPLVDFTLHPGQIRKFNDRATMARMLPGLGGAYANIAVSALTGLCSLDYVAADIYLKILAEVAGCKIGKVINHQVVWND